MTERLVDVLSANGNVLHIFPIKIESPGRNIKADDREYEAEALRAAARARLVPDADLETLTTRIHVSRSGRLEPYGDHRSVLTQTQEGLDNTVRERAYWLWEAEGRSQGRADEYWHRAHEQYLHEHPDVL